MAWCWLCCALALCCKIARWHSPNNALCRFVSGVFGTSIAALFILNTSSASAPWMTAVCLCGGGLLGQMAMVFGKQTKRRGEDDKAQRKKARRADREKRKRSAGETSSEEEDAEPWLSSPTRRDSGKRAQKGAAKEIRKCVMCGQAGPDSRGREATYLSEDTKRTVLPFCHEWEGVTPDVGLSPGFSQTRHQAQRLKHAILESQEHPTALWKHPSCLDAVRNSVSIQVASNQVAHYLLKKEEDESREEPMSAAGAAEPETLTAPSTRSQVPSVRAQPGRTGHCAVCAKRGDVHRLCEKESIQKVVDATKYHLDHEESEFHCISGIIGSQFMRLEDAESDADVQGYVLANDMELHNACRLMYCRSAQVYGRAAPVQETASERKERAEMGVCEYIRDALIGDGEGSAKYGVRVSDTYRLYEDVVGNRPGHVKEYREGIVCTYNERVAPTTPRKTELVCTMDEKAMTKGGYFSLQTSTHDALLFLCRQEEDMEELMGDMDALRSLKPSCLNPTVKQSFHVTAMVIREAFRQVQYTPGVTTAAGVTEEEAQRCGGGPVVSNLIYDCTCSEKELEEGKRENAELKKRCDGLAQDWCAASGRFRHGPP